MMTYAKNGKLLPVLQFASFDVDWISKFPKRSKRRKKLSILISFSKGKILSWINVMSAAFIMMLMMKQWKDDDFILPCCARWQLFEIFMKFRFTFHSFMESRSSNRSLQCWQFFLIQTMSIINLFFEIKLFSMHTLWIVYCRDFAHDILDNFPKKI